MSHIDHMKVSRSSTGIKFSTFVDHKSMTTLVFKFIVLILFQASSLYSLGFQTQTFRALKENRLARISLSQFALQEILLKEGLSF